MGYGDTLWLSLGIFSDKQRLLAGRSSGLTQGLAAPGSVMSGQVLAVADGGGEGGRRKQDSIAVTSLLSASLLHSLWQFDLYEVCHIRCGDRFLSTNPASCWFTKTIATADIAAGRNRVSFFKGDPRVSLGSSLCQVVHMLFVLLYSHL